MIPVSASSKDLREQASGPVAVDEERSSLERRWSRSNIQTGPN